MALPISNICSSQYCFLYIRSSKCLSSVFFMVHHYYAFSSTTGEFLFSIRIRLAGLVSAIHFSQRPARAFKRHHRTEKLCGKCPNGYHRSGTGPYSLRCRYHPSYRSSVPRYHNSRCQNHPSYSSSVPRYHSSRCRYHSSGCRYHSSRCRYYPFLRTIQALRNGGFPRGGISNCRYRRRRSRKARMLMR